MATSCTLCGRTPADGYAFIGGKRYCHGHHAYEGTGRTCYEYATTEFEWRLVNPETGEELSWESAFRARGGK